MSYQALYRKWRPDNFNDVKGQDTIVTTLKNQIKADRIGHAYLFCGTRGTGKTTVAKIFAKAVNCENPVDGGPCGECATCRAISAGVSMNVIEIDAASNNGVDNIREIREEVQYSPTEGKYKVYIIDEVHMLSIGAFNALLKTLEEPPAYVIFILATTEVAKIPITIMSRCQRYDFRRISIETIAGRLSDLMKEEGINVEDRAIKYVAKAADGSMRDALSLLDQCIAFYLGKDLKYENVLDVLGAVDMAVFDRMLQILLSGNVADCMQQMDELIMQGRDLAQFVNDFIFYLRNLLLIKTASDVSRIEDIIEVSRDNLAQMQTMAEQVDIETLMRFIRILSELGSQLKVSTQKRITTEVTFIKLMRPAMENKQAELPDVISRVTLLEEQLREALDQIKSGVTFVRPEADGGQTDAGGYTGMGSGVLKEVVKKRVYEAVPEDVAEIAARWDSVISSIDEPMTQNILKNAHVTLAEDGRSLEIMVQSYVAYNKLSSDEGKEGLVNLIEERTGIHVNIIVTKIDSEEDYHKRFVDLKELVGIDVVIDDKEEYI
ncbi:MAG: DNA polymerase III subunit gamma/tau [Lachnospira sp.]